MDESTPKTIFINNIRKLLDDLGESKTWLNKQIYGIDDNGRAKNNLFRSDQSEINISVAIKAATILNKSVDELSSVQYDPNTEKKLKVVDSENSYDLHGGWKHRTMPEDWQLVGMALEVLSSGTEYGRALKSNIKSFYEALSLEKKFDEHRKKHKELLTLIKTRGLPDNVVEFEKILDMVKIDRDAPPSEEDESSEKEK